MTGKIFQNSANIYDDEAKILFDYYKNAAEKIVSEEIDLENKIKNEEDNIVKNTKKNKLSKLIMIITGGLFVLGLIGTIIVSVMSGALNALLLVLTCLFLGGAILFFVGFFISKKAVETSQVQIKSFTEAKDNIRKDYKITKLGVAYVPVATKVPFEGKSFTVDHTGGMENTDFSLTVLHQPKELQKSLSDLETGMNILPVVESNECAESVDTKDYSSSIQNVTMHDYMGNIDRQVKNISYLLNDSEQQKVSLPIVTPNSEQDIFLNEYATTDVENKPVIPVFDTSDFAEKLDGFAKLSELKKELETSSDGENTEHFKKLINRLGDVVQVVSDVKNESTEKFLNYTNNILYAVLKSGYNQYSPTLEADEIARIREATFNYEDSVESYTPFNLKPSSKVKYDLFSGAWVAEDNSRTNMPFGMNQVVEEVLMPVINNLMNETRVERLKIYNGIKDQKLSYLTKWNQDVEAAFRDNRKTGQDLITELSNAYAEYNTAYQTYVSYKQTSNSMKRTGSLNAAEVQEVDSSDEMIAGFAEQAQECNNVRSQFQDYMDRLQDDIQLKADKFGHIEYYEASLRDSESRDMARSIEPSNLQGLDDRRKKLIPVSTYYATYAELPPTPNTEEALNNDFAVNMQEVAKSELAKIAEIENSGIVETEENIEDETYEDETSESMENETEENVDESAAVSTDENTVEDSVEEETVETETVETEESEEAYETDDADSTDVADDDLDEDEESEEDDDSDEDEESEEDDSDENKNI